MSNHKKLTGQGGKGSADRTGNKSKFNENFDRIFKPLAVGDKVSHKGHRYEVRSVFGGLVEIVAPGERHKVRLNQVSRAD